jgi:hypothetical protein
MSWPRRGVVLQHHSGNRRGRSSCCLGCSYPAAQRQWHYPLLDSGISHHPSQVASNQRRVDEGQTLREERPDRGLGAGVASCGWHRTAGMLQRRSVAIASLDGVPAAISSSEGPMPSWRLRAVDRASPGLESHESEAAAPDQRESFRVVWRLVHQLRRQSSIGPGVHGRESQPGIG